MGKTRKKFDDGVPVTRSNGTNKGYKKKRDRQIQDALNDYHKTSNSDLGGSVENLSEMVKELCKK